MRRWTVGALAAVAVLVLAAPAQAKGDASSVTITNPGGGPGGTGSGSGGSGSGGGSVAVLAAPIHLTGGRASAWMGESGIFQGMFADHPNAKGLGPALDVSMAYSCGDSDGTISQRLYPYASGGPLVHTLAGQSFCDGPLAPVWWEVGPAAMAVLQAHGLPATAPVVTAGDAGAGTVAGSAGSQQDVASGSVIQGANASTTAAGSSGSLPVVPLAVGIAAVAAVVALAVVQRRRRTVAA